MRRTYGNEEANHCYRFGRVRNEIIITHTVAAEMSLDIGDTVTVSSGSRNADYIITGINWSGIDGIVSASRLRLSFATRFALVSGIGALLSSLLQSSSSAHIWYPRE